MNRWWQLLGVVAFAFGAPSVSKANPYVRVASLSQSTAAVGEPIIAEIDFGMTFASIDLVCFHFKFEGDLFEADETLIITPLNIWASMSGWGFIGAGAPLAERSSCILFWNGYVPAVERFLDGQEDRIEISMQNGSVRIAELRIEIQGTPAIVPVRRPTWGVIKANYR